MITSVYIRAISLILCFFPILRYYTFLFLTDVNHFSVSICVRIVDFVSQRWFQTEIDSGPLFLVFCFLEVVPD